MSLEIGNVVKLKSVRSPEMVITSMVGDSKFECIWFPDAYQIAKHVFSKETLELVPKKETTSVL